VEEKSKETRSIDHAEKVLNADHYGLEKIKEAHPGIRSWRAPAGEEPKGSILCFVGPPGVGKTSLGMSIAKATGRKFVRLSLGGVRMRPRFAASAAPTLARCLDRSSSR